MKILTFCFLIFSTSTYGQFPDEYNFKKDTASFINYMLIIKTEIDSNSIIKYQTLTKHFNNQGFINLEYTLDNSGDTIELITSIFPNQFTEVQYHKLKNRKVDKGTFIYNHDDFLIQQIWNWGEGNENDTSTYTYNNQNQLIKKANQYEIGYYYDTLIYQNQNLISILSYDPKSDLRSSISYYYNDRGKLSEIKSFDEKGTLLSLEKFMHFNKNQPTLIEKNYFYFQGYKVQQKQTSKIDYYHNGKTKSEKSQLYKNDNLVWETHLIYSKEGFIKEYFYVDFQRKRKESSFSILQKER
ncbi:MAG: hypothetical protein AB8F94_08035 [Saprospiraceae bacterium]